MRLARVIGTVVATRKSENLQNLAILMIQPLDKKLQPVGEAIAAVDVVQAGPGEIVYYTLAREAAFALPEPNVPVDAAVTGIVDRVHLEDKGIIDRARIFSKNG
ncbi:MAG: EutN/CcmL family microcompartment protein [Candidatus Aminicenantes bacterium]|nr:EutN/CcmL family microcompartment protein [Candidatus Aminicenantes bacterium]